MERAGGIREGMKILLHNIRKIMMESALGLLIKRVALRCKIQQRNASISTEAFL